MEPEAQGVLKPTRRLNREIQSSQGQKPASLGTGTDVATRSRRIHSTALRLSVVLLLASASGAFATVSTSHLSTDAAASALIESSGGGFRFATEFVQLDKVTGKLALRQRRVRAPKDPAVEVKLKDWQNGVAVPFLLTFDGASRVTMKVTAHRKAFIVTNLPVFSITGDFNELFVRTEAAVQGGRVAASSLVLNGMPIPDTSSAADGASGALDILRIRGGSLAGGFTLTGAITMTWPRNTRPDNAKLGVQIWGAKVVVADATPPVVTITAPTNGSFVTTARPTLTASFADSGSGINLASIRLLLDGVDRTAEAQVTASGLSFASSSALGEGQHQADVTARDAAENEARVGWTFFVDTVPPSLTILAPGASLTAGYPRIEISLRVSDVTSGLDWVASSVQIDGVEVGPSCSSDQESASCVFSPLASGPHLLSAIVRDQAGNTSRARREFQFFLDQSPPLIVLETPRGGEVLRTPVVPVRGAVSDVSGVRFLSINGQEVEVVEGRFQTEVALEEGVNSAFVAALDAFGNSSTIDAKLVLDTTPPTLEVTSPLSGQVTNRETATLSGFCQDETGLSSLTVNDQPIPVQGDAFSTAVPLAEGANDLAIKAMDTAGNIRESRVEVFRYTLPSVSIDYPADLSFLATTVTEVRGSVSDPTAAVTVNGVAAVVSGGLFVVRDIPLIEGGNILTAVASNSDSRVGTSTIQVVRDLIPPLLNVDLPASGATVFTPTITVSGLVNDIVAGTVNSADALVTVNGRRAAVANRSFLLDDLPILPGENTLSVLATDASGNSSNVSLTILRVEPSGPRLAVVSGDRQRGVIGRLLGQPLVVELRDGQDQPVTGRPIVFRVLGGDGSLSGGRRRAIVATDSAGRASTALTLGMRAGVGNQRVEALAVGFGGPGLFTFDTLPGEPAKILVDAGDQQVGVTGQPLPRPLVAVVTDAGFNRLQGVGVHWRVVKGRGHFTIGDSELLAESDSDGRSIVSLTLDTEEGIAANVAEARISGLVSSPVVTFVGSARAAGGESAATSISGIVLDNQNQPLSGVTLRILESPLTAKTDSRGLFRIQGALVGTVRLVVDGSTVERLGSWPTLEFVVTTVPGRENPLTMPVYLLPLNLSNGILVDETRGGTLTLPELPGFALTIAPGSVIFPGGSRSGFVSVTPVHNDKVPMVPNFGQQPRLIVTIQPAGARFNPPAKLTLPNVEGLKPGEVTELYSFDHDLGHFVSIGPATVTEDGLVIASNPGVGILKAGWHCGGSPAATGTPHSCPPCMVCDGSQCVQGCSIASGSQQGDDNLTPLFASVCTCDDHDACTINDSCGTGKCKGAPLSPGTVEIAANGHADRAIAAIGEAVRFSSNVTIANCPDPKFAWSFGDGEESSEANPTHVFRSHGALSVRLKVRCGNCRRPLAEDAVEVFVIKVTRVVAQDGATQDNLRGERNWATLRKWGGTVTVKAVLSPEVPGAQDLVKWEGATPDIRGNDFATLSTDEAAKFAVKAVVGSSSESLDAWIMWATLELRSSGSQSPTNEARHPDGTSFPALGPVTDEANFADGFNSAEASAQVEIVAHLEPPGVNEIFERSSGWNFNQFVTAGGCSNGGIVPPILLQLDHPLEPFRDTRPQADDQIYYIDAPTVGLDFTVAHTLERYRLFEVNALWLGREASDTLFWTYFAVVDDDLDATHKPRNVDTLLNEVRVGKVPFPSSCRFQPRP